MFQRTLTESDEAWKRFMVRRAASIHGWFANCSLPDGMKVMLRGLHDQLQLLIDQLSMRGGEILNVIG